MARFQGVSPRSSSAILDENYRKMYQAEKNKCEKGAIPSIRVQRVKEAPMPSMQLERVRGTSVHVLSARVRNKLEDSAASLIQATFMYLYTDAVM